MDDIIEMVVVVVLFEIYFQMFVVYMIGTMNICQRETGFVHFEVVPKEYNRTSKHFLLVFGETEENGKLPARWHSLMGSFASLLRNSYCRR